MRYLKSFSRSQSDLPELPEAPFAFISLPGEDIIHCFTQSSASSASFRYHPFDARNKHPSEILSRNAHRAIIEEALSAMRDHHFEKVVVSRTKDVHLSKSRFEWTRVFWEIGRRYPAACINWFIDGEDMWMGATPELLLSKRGTTWKTVSIAGTQLLQTNLPLEDHAWHDKEIREQAIVTSYISSSLKGAGANGLQTSAPFNVQAGPLVHIKTDITFSYIGNVRHILETLHPTPAVCGFPLTESRDFIRAHETHDRSLYAGYLGIEYENGDADYFVNLRCMRIRKDYITLFAGGGIVPGSDPDKEWEETERKMDVMLSAVTSS